MITFHDFFLYFYSKRAATATTKYNKMQKVCFFVENNEWKTFRRAKVLDCRVPFARKLIQIRQPLIFKKWLRKLNM